MSGYYSHRLYCFDNIKFILIFLVVLGHLLEISPNWNGWNAKLYRLIYAFHMPAFIFITGLFATFKKEKIVFHFIYNYLFFQILYQIFQSCILDGQSFTSTTIQFTTPYWILWYLLVTLFYYLFIPLIDTRNTSVRIMVTICSFLLSLLWGYDSSLGYYLSLGRFFTFLPFFVSGFYAKETLPSFIASKNKLLRLIIICITILTTVYILNYCTYPGYYFYGSYSFSSLNYDIFTKLSLQLLGIIGIMFLLFVASPLLNTKIPVITTLGQNSLPIFLLHGFFIKAMAKTGFLSARSPFFVFLLALLIIFVLGNTLSNKIFYRLCSGWWIKSLFNKSIRTPIDANNASQK